MQPHLDERALAARWSMSPRTLQRWRQDGHGPVYLKLGGRIVYRVCDIETWEMTCSSAERSKTPPEHES